MAGRRRIDPDTGNSALRQWTAAPVDAPRGVVATAVRYSLEEFAARHPGGAVELRVPPFGVAQAIAGTHHHRGTPPAVVETDAATWLRLVTGREDLATARHDGRLTASGARSDLAGLLPLWGRPGDQLPEEGTR